MLDRLAAALGSARARGRASEKADAGAHGRPGRGATRRGSDRRARRRPDDRPDRRAAPLSPRPAAPSYLPPGERAAGGSSTWNCSKLVRLPGSTITEESGTVTQPPSRPATPSHTALRLVLARIAVLTPRAAGP
jgi:hypothetical protein